MTCVHLQQLYKLCQEHDMKLGGTDLIRLVCRQCGAHEVCPSTLMDECDVVETQAVESHIQSLTQISAGVQSSPRS